MENNIRVKMLNGLIIDSLSENQIKSGLETGRFLPSDYIDEGSGEWLQIKETAFTKKSVKKFNGWMALFALSFIFNICMLLMFFWQKSRIDHLLK